MRSDPRNRLDRRTPGAGVQPGSVLRLHLDELRLGGMGGPRPDPIPARDQKELLDVRQRPPRRLAEVGPHAPQLIRLIRSPYAMEGVRGKRITVIEGSPATQVRQPFGTQTHAAQEEWPKIGSPSPIQPRPRPFTVRPSAAEPVPAFLLPVPAFPLPERA